MMNVTRFLREGARFMAADRPDLWNVEDAFDRLTQMFSYLVGVENSGEIGTAGFVLQKFVGVDDDEGVITWRLARNILTFEIFEEEGESLVSDWTDTSALSNIGLDIPDPSLDNDD